MPAYQSIGGVYLKIEPAPDQLPEPTPRDTSKSGAVEVTYLNYSRIPAKAQFRRITSNNTHVATARGNAKTIQIPARPGKFTARQPASAAAHIANWFPKNRGVTSLEAVFDVATNSAVLGMLQPTADVKTT